jgi:hypothetical protein
MTTKFPILYREETGKATRFWRIEVDGNVILKQSGIVGTNKPISSTRAITGKNKGKKNETTDHQQALLVAEKDFASQLDKHYVPKDPENAFYKKMMEEREKHGNSNYSVTTAGQAKNTTNMGFVKSETDVKPMLLTEWSVKLPPNLLKHFPMNTNEAGEKTSFHKPVYVQPKYDGYRAVASQNKDGSIILSSRSNKQFMWLNHIREELKKIMASLPPGTMLDGELYEHTLPGVDPSDRFSVISSICKMNRTKPHEHEKSLSFYVFDIIDPANPDRLQDERHRFLANLFKNRPKGGSIKLAPTHSVNTLDQLYQYYDHYLENQYEGIIIRANDNKYRCGPTRSLNVRKFKPDNDFEAKIVGVHRDGGVGPEHFSWICEMPGIPGPSGLTKTFRAKQVGTVQARQAMYKNRDQYIGKIANIRFQELTAKEGGVPRFSRCMGIRADMN